MKATNNIQALEKLLKNENSKGMNEMKYGNLSPAMFQIK
jgi:hypothetical protein